MLECDWDETEKTGDTSLRCEADKNLFEACRAWDDRVPFLSRYKIEG